MYTYQGKSFTKYSELVSYAATLLTKNQKKALKDVWHDDIKAKVHKATAKKLLKLWLIQEVDGEFGYGYYVTGLGNELYFKLVKG